MPDTPKRRQVETAPSADRTAGTASTSGAGRNNGSFSQKAGEAGEKVRQQARDWAGEAKTRGRRMLDEQKHNAVEQISGIAQVLHKSADECMNREDQRVAGRVIEQAATALDRLSDSLRNRDVDDLMDQATSLMRRQPAWFVAGSIAAGFLLARFATSSRRNMQGQYGAGYEGYTGGEVDGQRAGAGESYVTSAHVNPGEVGNGRTGAPPVMPTGRRDY